jgi:hypothetical protein
MWGVGGVYENEKDGAQLCAAAHGLTDVRELYAGSVGDYAGKSWVSYSFYLYSMKTLHMHDGDHGAVVRSAVAGAYLRALPHLAPCPPSFPPCPFLSLPSTSWPRPGAPFLPSALLPSLPPSFPSPLPLSSPKTKQNSPHTSVQAFNAQFTLGGKDEAQFRPPQGASSTCARAADATGSMG